MKSWVWVGPTPNGWYLYKKRKGTKGYREKGHVTMEADTGVMLPRAKEHQKDLKPEKPR